MSVRGNPSKDAHYVEDVVAIRETDKALLIAVADGEQRWVPKKCIHDDSEVCAEGDEGTLALLTWFAEKDGGW